MMRNSSENYYPITIAQRFGRRSQDADDYEADNPRLVECACPMCKGDILITETEQGTIRECQTCHYLED